MLNNKKFLLTGSTTLVEPEYHQWFFTILYKDISGNVVTSGATGEVTLSIRYDGNVGFNQLTGGSVFSAANLASYLSAAGPVAEVKAEVTTPLVNADSYEVSIWGYR